VSPDYFLGLPKIESTSAATRRAPDTETQAGLLTSLQLKETRVGLVGDTL